MNNYYLLVLVVEGILVARHFFSPLHSTPGRKEEGKEKVAPRSEFQQKSTPSWSAGGSCPLEVGPGVPLLYPTHPLIIKLINIHYSSSRGMKNNLNE